MTCNFRKSTSSEFTESLFYNKVCIIGSYWAENTNLIIFVGKPQQNALFGGKRRKQSCLGETCLGLIIGFNLLTCKTVIGNGN